MCFLFYRLIKKSWKIVVLLFLGMTLLYAWNDDNPTAAQVNQLVDAKVYLNNNEIGNLEYNDDVNKKIVVVFEDGTRENATNYVNQELVDELEAIFSNYID